MWAAGIGESDLPGWNADSSDRIDFSSLFSSLNLILLSSLSDTPFKHNIIIPFISFYLSFFPNTTLI